MASRIGTLGSLGLGLALFSGCPNDITSRTILTTDGQGESGSSGDTGRDEETTSSGGDTTGSSGGRVGTAETSSSGGGSEPPDATAVCGDGVRGPAEDCDSAGESISCDADCTFPLCGDGYTNASAGEPCDDGGESATCNADCTLARCGDHKVNPSRGETCDDGEESATCNADCTPAVCGDGVVNSLAGEQCDDGLPPADGDGCSSTCALEEPDVCDGGVDPFTGDPWVVCDATEASAWISSGPDGGNFHAQAICEALGYDSVGAIGGNCGSPCSFCEAGSSCDATGLRAFNGGGNCGSDDDGPVLCTTVMWICS